MDELFTEYATADRRRVFLALLDQLVKQRENILRQSFIDGFKLAAGIDLEILSSAYSFISDEEKILCQLNGAHYDISKGAPSFSSGEKRYSLPRWP